MEALDRIANGGISWHWNWFREFWNEQEKWSEDVFGPSSVRGPLGPTKHLAKEVLTELLACHKADVELLLSTVNNDRPPQSLNDVEEYADCIFLVIDACRRAGISSDQLMTAMFRKLDKNKRRAWPKFNPANVNEAVEHDRSKD